MDLYSQELLSPAEAQGSSCAELRICSEISLPSTDDATDIHTNRGRRSRTSKAKVYWMNEPQWDVLVQDAINPFRASARECRWGKAPAANMSIDLGTICYCLAYQRVHNYCCHFSVLSMDLFNGRVSTCILAFLRQQLISYPQLFIFKLLLLCSKYINLFQGNLISSILLLWTDNGFQNTVPGRTLLCHCHCHDDGDGLVYERALSTSKWCVAILRYYNVIMISFLDKRWVSSTFPFSLPYHSLSVCNSMWLRKKFYSCN